jgi:N-acetylmuramoyl-L-alanine amidase
VNGRAVGPAGCVKRANGTLFVLETLTGRLRAALRTAPPPRPPQQPEDNRPVVVLDAGHGGKDPGAPSCLGIWEKSVNLSVAQTAAALLRRRGVNVVMTRSDDTFVELEERAAIANRRGAELFVSIHSDAARNPAAKGFTVYVARAANGRTLAAAEVIRARMSATGTHDRGVRRADYRVLVRTACPAVLVELGYLSNRYEAARLADASHRRRLAGAISGGVIEFIHSK